MPDSILSCYGLRETECNITSFGSGLINHTWKIVSGDNAWLLQKVNQHVFKRPGDIMENCRMLSDFLKMHYPDYLFVTPLPALDGNNFCIHDGSYYRLFPFISNSYSCDAVSEPALAYEASRQFGKFTSFLSSFNTNQLHVTLPDFHNLTLRQKQFESSRNNGNKNRLTHCADAIAFLDDQMGIVETFEKIQFNPSFKKRVTHHDTKINNVLFDRDLHTGICVVDLDTVMPGFYISDVGDMLRTYLCPFSEEEKDFSLIQIREDYFGQIAKGYLEEMRSELSDEEKKYFLYAGKFAIYMQAIRFMTDYFNNDIYYSIHYAEQNLVRATNQITLLLKFTEKESRLRDLLDSLL
jgi:Ser/Thr protein kinase RdoA (MazF antagonist)